MIWIDLGIIILLTLRIALLRPVLPQLLDPNRDFGSPEGNDEQP